METLFINIIKSCGLIGMFYMAYYLLLRKETFFTANRWFLLAGLLTSVVLPWIVFTTIVWVEPTANTNVDWSKIPVTTSVQQESFQINWYLVLGIVYIIGTVLFLAQFAFDYFQLNSVLKGKNIYRQADHKFIDLKENIAPFSYFNTIVYNSSLYNETELESILEHEKVHSEQYHTIDVLITRFFCILFWFNPFIWLYKKAILQNLEFIADSEASKNISDKKAYQLTLLKITTHENCVVLTNHFYQSLIKKRIIMLNKNQSKKRNFWKYSLILPVLIAFVFLFQIEAIAQKNATTSTKNTAVAVDLINHVYSISKTTTDQALNSEKKIVKDKFNTDVAFSEIKRNSKNEITAIKIEITSPNKEKNIFIYSDNQPIEGFLLFAGKLKNKETVVGLYNGNSKSNKWKQTIYYTIPPPPPPIPMVKSTKVPPPPPPKMKSSKISPPPPPKMKSSTTPPALPPPPPPKAAVINFLPPKVEQQVQVSTDKSQIHFINGQKVKSPLYIIDGKKADPGITFNNINPDAIESMSVIKGPGATALYGDKGANGVILVTSKKNATILIDGQEK